jgi:hypothetical protein
MRPELLLLLAFPRAGGTFTDPETHASIIRVTDEKNGAHCVHAYSTWSPLNADDTRLLIACDDVPLLYRVDGERIAFDRPLDARVQFEGAIWSRSDPDLLYALEAHRGTRLVAVDVARRKQRVLHDFAGELPAGAYPAQLDASDDARVFTFHDRDASGKHDAWVWDGARLRRFPRPDDKRVDETRIDPRGTRLLVSFTDGSRAFWDLATGAVTSFMMSGHYDLGDGFLIGDDGVNDGVMLVRDGSDPVDLVRWDAWTVADHVSVRRGLAVVSTYGSRADLLLVPLDGTPARLLAHTYSTGAEADAGWRYFAQPRAAIDQLGRWVVWTSDLGSSDRLDVLMLRLPASASGRTP